MSVYPPPGPNAQLAVFMGTATVTFTSGPFANLGNRSALFCLDVTAGSGTGANLVLSFQGVSHSGFVYTLLSSSNSLTAAQLISTSPFLFVIGMGVTPAANMTIAYPFPPKWQVLHTISGTTPSFTYSLDVDLV